MKPFDFSCKSNILLEDEEGLLVPMSEPYFRSKKVTEGVWQILSDGDYSYLVEGSDEALLIDSGYGAGNIRDYCQTLTTKPVDRIANTHDHFDHTANNGRFDCAYMSAETQPLATIPFPSFEGIYFPRDYPVIIVDDGDIIKLKGRELLVLKIPDHAIGSIAFLDQKSRILFAGDELGMDVKPLNGSVQHWMQNMEKLMDNRDLFDQVCFGGGITDAEVVEHNLDCARRILDGHEGEPTSPPPFPNISRTDEKGRTIWKRRLPHPGDGPKGNPEGNEYKRLMEYAGCRLMYDIRRIKD